MNGPFVARHPVHLLVLAGVVGTVGGLAAGGIAVGAGAAVAAAVWLVAVLLRRRAAARAPRRTKRDVGAA